MTTGRPPRRESLSSRTSALLVAGALTAAAALGWALGSARGRAPAATAAGSAADPGPVRFTIELDSDSAHFGAVAIAPDGRTVVYAAEGPDSTRLYVRRIDEVTARPLGGTEGGDAPFFSPDGAWVAFFSHGALRKVRVDGGTPVMLADLPHTSLFWSGTWGTNDTILYTNTGVLHRVSASGGPPSRVTVADTALRILHPHFLPGARAVLATVTPDYNTGRLCVLDLASGRIRQFGPGLAPHHVGSDLVYQDLNGDLYRQPFDLERLEPVGSAEQIASGLDAQLGRAAFAVAAAGQLVYRTGSRAIAGQLKLTVSDREGRPQRVFPMRGAWTPRFAADGRRIAHGGFAPWRDSSDLWVTDLETGATQRLTTDGHDNNDPQWSPDGRSIAYSAEAAGGKDVFLQPLDGGPARLVIARPGLQWPTDWVGRGNALLFTNTELGAGTVGVQDVWVQPMDGGAARPFVATSAREGGARASPDGRWVAYQSDETGRFEVYVQSFPTPGRKTLVSSAGGTNPVWRRDGRELYYWQRDRLVAARIDAGAADAPLTVRSRTPLFRAPYVENFTANYDVSPEGTRFVIVTGGEHATRLVVALGVLGAGRPAKGGGP